MKSTKIILFLLGMLSSACGTLDQSLPVEPGVSRSLAEYRKTSIRSLEYSLSFDVPESRNEPIPGNNRITFEMAAKNHDLQIDFREELLPHWNAAPATISNPHLVYWRRRLVS